MFEKLFQSTVDIMEARFKGMGSPRQNPADRGELIEHFVKDFLNQFLSENFAIMRGGNIINEKGNPSGQVDIVLTGKNYIKIFADKGLYPIETVGGVFCVTATLTEAKFKNDVKLLQTIPKVGAQFITRPDHPLDSRDFQKVMGVSQRWERLMPFKCVYGFRGNISAKWIEYLEEQIRSGIPKSNLPDLITVHKKGMILKMAPDSAIPQFRFIDFTIDKPDFQEIPNILQNLFQISVLQHEIIPAYFRYFRFAESPTEPTQTKPTPKPPKQNTNRKG